MRKPRDKNRVARTLNYWLARPDNSSSFRWMGQWCAMIAPVVPRKAERGSKGPVPRCRRGRKRRGSRESRSARKLALASEHAAIVTDEKIHAMMMRGIRCVNRISYMDKRIEAHLSTLIDRFNGTDERVKKLKVVIDNYLCRDRRVFPDWPKGALRRRRIAGVKMLRKNYQLQRVMTTKLRGHWGLPLDATIQRLRIHGRQHVGTNALPRVPHQHTQSIDLKTLRPLVEGCFGCKAIVLSESRPYNPRLKTRPDVAKAPLQVRAPSGLTRGKPKGKRERTRESVTCMYCGGVGIAKHERSCPTKRKGFSLAGGRSNPS